MFSFETGLEGWSAANADESVGPFGATDGTQALQLANIGPGFLNDIGLNASISPTSFPEAFRQFSLAAAEVVAGNRPKMEFDFTLDASTATGPAFMQLAMFINSTAGYKDYGTGGLIGGNLGEDFPRLDTLAATHGATLDNTGPNRYHVAIPLRTVAEAPGINQGLALDIPAGVPSHYFQLGFKANSGYTGTVKYAIDNIRFTGIPTFTAHTLFSWETPDNPGTTGVNEQFEGWVTTNEVPTPPPGVTLQPGHSQAIVATGATNGTHAYQIDRTSMVAGFTWGSQFGLSGVGNPANQTQINDFITRINAAERIAFDVTYRRDFPAHDPSFTNFFIHFADGTGTFYQGETGQIDPAHAPDGVNVTTTLEIPFSAFVDQAVGSTKSLLVDGLQQGATFFEIGIASNTDDGQVYQIDNVRLLTRLQADFNTDVAVNGLDFATWKAGFGASDAGDTDGDNDTDGADFLTWQREFGLGPVSAVAAAGSVPEPATWMLAVGVGALVGLRCRGLHAGR
jgi:hypothetical protein